MTAPVLRLALDQNFPVPLLDAMSDFVPSEVKLEHLPRIDRRLSLLGDRKLIIALYQRGFDGLITNNYKMLNDPAEFAAIIATKSVLVAVEGLGHDPIRAAGALLMELPGLPSRIRPRRGNVIRLRFTQRRADDAWDYLARVAEQRGRPAADLWAEVKVTDEEMTEPVLG